MKKIIAIVLGILILAAGLIGCVSCKPEEPDPYEGLYGVYKLVPLKEVDSGIEVRHAKTNSLVNVEALPSQRVANRYPEDGNEINDFLIGLRAAIGNTITITKDKVVFSEGDKVLAEFEYEHHTFYISFYEKADEMGFPIDNIDYTVFENLTPLVYQLWPRTYKHFGENGYEIIFYYLVY